MSMTPVRRTLVAVLGAAAVLAGGAAPASAQAVPCDGIQLPFPGAPCIPTTPPSGLPTLPPPPGGPAPTASATPTGSPTATPTPTGSASPTPSGTATPTPSRTGTPTPTPTATATCPTIVLPGAGCIGPPAGSATPTSTASPTGTATPSGSPSPSAGAVLPPSIAVSPSTITAVQQSATVAGTGTPGSTIEVYAYSRPSTDYVVVRSTVVGDDGRYSFQVRPSGNTRLYARTVTSSGEAVSDSIVLAVRTSLNLKVARTGTRAYRFTGSLLPKRPGQLITVFSQKADGSRVIVGRARNAADGSYRLDRTFSGTGAFTFFTGTGKDINNEANSSNLVRTTVR